MKRIAFFFFALLSLTGGQVVDRIAAVVNDDIILVSEVEEKLFLLDAQGQLKSRDSTQVAQMRKEILDRLIEERLVVQRAKSQPDIKTDETDLQKRVDDAMDKVRSQFPSPDAFRNALNQEGITETMLRERYHNDIEQEMLGQRIVSREVRSKVEVTTDDVEKYFKENKDQLPRKPTEVELAHFLARSVDASVEQAARDKIEKARARIVGGEKFEDVAAQVSDDPSRGRGGLLGWFQKGDLDPAFEAAAESLQVGELSGPVRSAFGYHVLEVLEREGARFKVRHILALVEPKPEQIQAAHDRAEAARARITSGESFETVVKEASEDPETKDQGGNLGWVSPQLLLPEVAGLIDSLKVGELSPVVRSARGFHVFKVLNRRAGEDYTYDEIKDRLKTYLEQQQLEKAYDTWMKGIRDSAYVEIKSWSR
jgi:peptidyl-prolyl cis-trans isomerase SurA